MNFGDNRPLSTVLLSLESGSRPKGGVRNIAAGVTSVSGEQMTPDGGFDFRRIKYIPRAHYDGMRAGKIRRSDILIVKDGATTGKTCFVGDDFPHQEAAGNEHVFVCRANPALADSRFLFYWLWGEAGQRAILRNVRGSTIGGIKRGFADRVLVPLPSLAVQRRIAGRLAKRLALVAEMRAAAEGQAEAVRGLPSAFLRRVFSHGDKLAKGWTRAKLGDLCEKSGQFINPQSAEAATLPYIGLEHIESQSGRILGRHNGGGGKEVKSISFAFDARHVLYGKLRPYLNKVALPDFAGRSSTELVPLLPRKKSDRFFLAWFLRHPAVAEFAMRHKTGSRMPRVDINRLFDFPITIPATAAERRKIGDKLNAKMSAVAEAKAALDLQLEAIRALPAAHLREAFERR